MRRRDFITLIGGATAARPLAARAQQPAKILRIGIIERIHAYADRIVIRQNGRIVSEHPRSFCRGETIYDPGITCRCLPASTVCLAQRRTLQAAGRDGAHTARLAGADDGNRQMVDILTVVLADGLLPAVEAA